MIQRLYVFLLPAVLAFSFSKAAPAENPENGDLVISAAAGQEGMESFLKNVLTAETGTIYLLGIPAPNSIASPLSIPGSARHPYGIHYLDFLYKQVLCLCSLYWMLAGYRVYRSGRSSSGLSDNSVSTRIDL